MKLTHRLQVGPPPQLLILDFTLRCIGNRFYSEVAQLVRAKVMQKCNPMIVNSKANAKGTLGQWFKSTPRYFKNAYSKQIIR